MATKKTGTGARASKSKAEIENEFETVKEANEAASELDPKAAEVAKRNAEAVKKVAKSLSVDAVVKDFGSLGIGVAKAIADIQQKMQQSLVQLQQVQEAVDLAKVDLETLHGKDIVASQISNLLAQHEEHKARIHEESTAMKSRFAEEKAFLEKQSKEYAAELKKTREREQQDYDYQKANERKRAEDEFQEKMRARERETTRVAENLQRDWTSREESLKTAEKELSDLRAQVASFPEASKKEADKQTAIATSSLKKDHTNELAIAKMTADSESRALRQENDGLKRNIATLEGTVTQLRTDLASKSEQVVKIAESAVQSASGRAALEAVKDVQREAAGGSSKK